MIAGIIVGGTIWVIFYALFFVFPDTTSFAAALFMGPFAGGYFSSRLGGNRTALILTFIGSIAALILSLTYIPDTSWEYPHHLWAGVSLLTTLLVLGNFLFLTFGSLIGVRVRVHRELKAEPPRKMNIERERDKLLRGTASNMPGFITTKIANLEAKEKDLQNDLTVIKAKKGLDEISPELLEEKKNGLERQLLDIILEKERLIRKSEGNR